MVLQNSKFWNVVPKRCILMMLADLDFSIFIWTINLMMRKSVKTGSWLLQFQFHAWNHISLSLSPSSPFKTLPNDIDFSTKFLTSCQGRSIALKTTGIPRLERIPSKKPRFKIREMAFNFEFYRQKCIIWIFPPKILCLLFVICFK